MPRTGRPRKLPADSRTIACMMGFDERAFIRDLSVEWECSMSDVFRLAVVYFLEHMELGD
jgi:hypothetical protein